MSLILKDIMERATALDAERSRKRTQATPTRLELACSVPVTELDLAHATMQRVRDAFRTLDEHMVRTPDQVEVHERAIAALCLSVYRGHLGTHMQEILEFNHIEKVLKGVGFQAPRRLGKTWCICMYLAVCMIAIPSFEGIVISGSALSAGKNVGFARTLQEVLRKAFGINRFNRDGKHETSIILNSTVRKVNCFSGHIGDNLRGIGCEVLVLEEAAFLEQNTVVNVAIPIMRVDYTSIIMISSPPQDENNMFARFMRGNFLYTRKISYVCEDCEKIGIRETCIHRAHALPTWIDTSNDEELDKITGGGDSLMVESMGIERKQDDTRCFKQHLVEQLFAKPRMPVPNGSRYVYMGVDPVGGSSREELSKSDFVLYTICGPGTIILGAEAINVARFADYKDRVLEHIRRMRARPGFENSTIVLDVESGTGLEADHIQSLVFSTGNVIALNDFAGGRKPGTLTTNHNKMEMTQHFQVKLEKGDIFFAEDFITTHSDPRGLMQEIKNQLCQFRATIVPSKSNRTGNTIVFSGKGPNNTLKDDLCFTLIRTLWAEVKFFKGNFRHLRY